MRVDRDVLLPRPPEGMAPGALMALAVHGGLVVALTLSVDWRVKAPEPVSAELWAALPQVAAPAPSPAPAPQPEPPPPPPPPAPQPAPAPPAPAPAPAAPDAQIAIERAEKRRIEQQQKAEAAQAAAEKKRQQDLQRQRELAERKREAEQRQQAEEQRIAKLREDQLQRMLGSLPAAATPSTGTAARDAAPSQDYINRLAQAFRRNLKFGGQITGDPVAEVEVSATPSGVIIGRRLVKSTGNPALDDAILRAIDATGTLPRDPTVRLPPSFTVAFRPNE